MSARTKRASPVMAWAVQARSNRGLPWILPHTIKPRRSEALAAFLHLWESGQEAKWRYWKRRGYRLVRVRVEVVEP